MTALFHLNNLDSIAVLNLIKSLLICILTFPHERFQRADWPTTLSRQTRRCSKKHFNVNRTSSWVIFIFILINERNFWRIVKGLIHFIWIIRSTLWDDSLLLPTNISFIWYLYMFLNGFPWRLKTIFWEMDGLELLNHKALMYWERGTVGKTKVSIFVNSRLSSPPPCSMITGMKSEALVNSQSSKFEFLHWGIFAFKVLGRFNPKTFLALYFIAKRSCFSKR